MNAAKTFLSVAFLLMLPAGAKAQAEPCVDGEAGGHACSHIDFIAHLTPAELGGAGEVLNDIWGWVDPLNGDEYALVGMENGTAFLRILGDGTPEFLGRLPASDGASGLAKPAEKSCHDDACGGGSSWRDVKIHDHYAYIVSEAPGHGVQIFDLHALRTVSGDAPAAFLADSAQSYYAHYAGIGHAHNLFINEDTARAYIVGHDGNGRAGGLHILSLDDPMNPVHIGEANSDGYTHDVQCVVHAGIDPDVAVDSEICFASNEDTLTVWDVTNAASPARLARVPYSDSGYTHQGWLSEDQRYFFLNDELDELDAGTRTHLRVFDVSDVQAPELVTDYLAPTLAIDHNNYVHGRWLYQSNYAAGLRILDVLDPLHPVEAGYFDPQAADTAGFYGTWSNFRFPSGYTVFTDINGGIFVVHPMLPEGIAEPDLAVTLSLVAAEVDEGDAVGGEVVAVADATLDAQDVLLTLHLPRDARFENVIAPGGWSCASESGGRVQLCRTATFAAGGEAAFTFSIVSDEPGDVELIAMVYANVADALPTDNLASVTLEVAATRSIGSGGGSGGGALAWLLLLLCPLAVTRRSVRA